MQITNNYNIKHKLIFNSNYVSIRLQNDFVFIRIFDDIIICTRSFVHNNIIIGPIYIHKLFTE